MSKRNKFSVGDRVRIVGIKPCPSSPLITRDEDIVDKAYKRLLGTTDIIRSNANGCVYKYTLKGNDLAWCDEELEKVEISNKIGGELIKDKDNGKKK